MLLFPFICFQLDIVEFIPSLLYFGYTTLMVLSFWLLTGTIGFYAAYMFIRKIYAAVKIDWAVTDAAVLGFCWRLFYFVHILYFNVYNSILYVQQALIECRGNQEGWEFFFSLAQQPHPLEWWARTARWQSLTSCYFHFSLSFFSSLIFPGQKHLRSSSPLSHHALNTLGQSLSPDTFCKFFLFIFVMCLNLFRF